IEGGAELEHALPRALYRQGKIGSRRRVEQQDDAVKLALASAARERQANREKERPAPVRQRRLHAVDHLLEAVRIDVAAIENAVREFADDFARAFAGEHGLVRRVLQQGRRIVTENQSEQFSKRGAIGGVRAEEISGTGEPRLQRGVRLDVLSGAKPAALAEDCGDIPARKKIHG